MAVFLLRGIEQMLEITGDCEYIEFLDQNEILVPLI